MVKSFTNNICIINYVSLIKIYEACYRIFVNFMLLCSLNNFYAFCFGQTVN